MLRIYDWPFLHVSNLQDNLLFSSLILGSVFSEYVLFYGDYLDLAKFDDFWVHDFDKANCKW